MVMYMNCLLVFDQHSTPTSVQLVHTQIVICPMGGDGGGGGLGGGALPSPPHPTPTESKIKWGGT